MDDPDLEHILKLRKNVRGSADPRAFSLLRGLGEARWAIAEEEEGVVAGMVGAVPLGEVGILCHLAVHQDYRGNGLGARLSFWAVSYLRSRGARVVRRDTPGGESLQLFGFQTHLPPYVLPPRRRRSEKVVPECAAAGGEVS
jgi:GNAT superfamily N-acetyltransferase